MGLTCKQYKLEFEIISETIKQEISQGVLRCPICGDFLLVHGNYTRKTIDSLGNALNLEIIQSRCKNKDCCKTHALIPDFIMPYKHYSLETIEMVLSEIEKTGKLNNLNCPAEDTTIRRWYNEFKERGQLALGWLLNLLFEVYQKNLSLLKLHNLSLLKSLERVVKEFFELKSPFVIGKVNCLLTKSNLGYV